MNQAKVDAVSAADTHENDNAAYLQDYADAAAAVQSLTAASTVTTTVSAATQALSTLTTATGNAVTAVQQQLARVEALVAAERTQATEKAAWDERVSAASTAKGNAQTAKNDADTALTEAEEQVTKRSWIFTVLGRFDTTNWAADCDTNANGYCQLSENTSTRTATVSNWEWNANDNCDYNDGSAKLCKMYGLKGSSTGLTQSATAYKGADEVLDANNNNSVTSAATGLFSALNSANWAWVSPSVNAGTTKLADAVAKFEAW